MPPARRAPSKARELQAEAHALLEATEPLPIVIRDMPFTLRPIGDWDIDAFTDLEDAFLKKETRKFRAWAEGALVDPKAWEKVKPRLNELIAIFTQIEEMTGESLGKLLSSPG
jgi:hypothetical protein